MASATGIIACDFRFGDREIAKRSPFKLEKQPLKRMAEPTGFEPATSDVTGRRSNQLNYDSAKNYFQSSISDLRSSIKSAIRNPKSEIIYWWARRDSNPQPLPCKGSRLPLTYVPIFKNQSPIPVSSAPLSLFMIVIRSAACRSRTGANQRALLAIN